MNTLAKTLVLLSTILYAIPDAPISCEAVPTVAASPGAAAVVAVAQASSRLFKRSTNDNLTTTVKNFVTSLSSVPMEVMRDLGRVVQLIFQRIRSFIESILILYNELGPRTTIPNFLGLRSRRSLPGISDILSLINPFAILARSIRSVQDVAQKQMGGFLSGLINVGIEFLATTGLPWLHETLDTIAKTPNLPSLMRRAIDDFDALYNVLQLTGFVGSSATG